MKKATKRPLTDEEIMAYDNVPIDVAARYIGWSSPTIYRAAGRAGTSVLPFAAGRQGRGHTTSAPASW